MTAPFRFLRYSWVALMSAGSDWLVFAVLVSLIGMAHLEGLMVARVVGGAVPFLANRYWTWGAHRRVAMTQQGRRFLVLYGFSYGLAVTLFSLLVDGLGDGALSRQTGHRRNVLPGQLRLMNRLCLPRPRRIRDLLRAVSLKSERKDPRRNDPCLDRSQDVLE